MFYQTKYLTFAYADEQKPKTKVINVTSRLQGCRLGVIKWLPIWRQYAFFPEPDTAFDGQCLRSIELYIATIAKEKYVADAARKATNNFKYSHTKINGL